MNGLRAFLRKELIEYCRTYKLCILLGVFIAFGILSPMLAKMLPSILSSMLDESMSALFSVSEPTALDSYTQFFKNITQMGLIALVLVCSATLSSELSKGTLIPLLTKGLSRTNVILAKFIMGTIVWTLCYCASFFVTWLYTMMLFAELPLYHLALSVCSVWVFGVFLLALILFASSFITASYGVLLSCAACIAVLLTLNIVPSVHDFNPLLLISDNVTMLQEGYLIQPIWTSLGVTSLATILLLVLSCYLFNRRVL